MAVKYNHKVSLKKPVSPLGSHQGKWQKSGTRKVPSSGHEHQWGEARRVWSGEQQGHLQRHFSSYSRPFQSCWCLSFKQPTPLSTLTSWCLPRSPGRKRSTLSPHLGRLKPRETQNLYIVKCELPTPNTLFLIFRPCPSLRTDSSKHPKEEPETKNNYFFVFGERHNFKKHCISYLKLKLITLIGEVLLTHWLGSSSRKLIKYCFKAPISLGDAWVFPLN